LPIADCRLPIADCRLPLADCRLPLAACRLPITRTCRVRSKSTQLSLFRLALAKQLNSI